MNNYESYRDTGLTWINKIPANWNQLKINAIFEERREKVSDKDYEALSVTKNGVFKQLKNVAKTTDGDNRKKVRIDDFVINSRSDRKGSSGLSNFDGSVSLINTVLKIKKEYPRYIHYLLKSVPFQEEFYRNGKGIVADLWSTNFQSMKSIVLPIPPIEEQEQIANFLDWKINEIDKLILVEKNKIIEFEKLKTISLNKLITANENYKKIKIKFFANLYGRIGWQGLNSSEYSNKGVYLITGTDFANGTIDFSKSVRVPKFRWEQNSKIQIKNGDLLITKDGTVGKLAIVNNLKEKATLNSGIMKIDFIRDDIVTKEYLFYVLKSNIFKNWFIDLNAGFATIIHLYQKDFYNFYFNYPSIERQKQIVEKIKLMESAYDTEITNINAIITKLFKLKQSLLAEVVTGQIDVRNIVIPEYEKIALVDAEKDESYKMGGE
ncbi:restriction endonuclease subunit S [Streptococcus zalophi]|uniref:restriction endonuclease subunit S n=1 Tax=Streptococcus zalophi TaxID=640031 RepID=UPI00215BD4FF|nr:restriction endonuclease subunit S [Streptococcus zalophi]MCR8967320.1 restriction endonuclease subunit S [Streptococcus zalophi]